MKFHILPVCLLLSCNIGGKAQITPFPLPRSTEQMTTIDSGFIRIWYAFNPLKVSDSKTYDDLQRLDIGSHFSKYYSYFVYNSDSLVTEWGKHNGNAQSIPLRLGEKGKIPDWSEYVYSEYFKCFSSNSLTEYSRMPMYLYQENSRYTEQLPIQEWEIHEDTIMIIGYCCQKATCTFRGREYTAWFSMDIPISNGPWKFGGLPGLILKVYDMERLFVYECIRIEEQNKNKFPIKLYNDYNKYRKRTRREVLKLQREVNENFLRMAGITLRSGKLPEKKPHYYLELE